MMKPKTRKAPGAKPGAPKAASVAPIFNAAQTDAVIKRAHEQCGDKLKEAQREMWNGLNFLKLIELAAGSSVDDRDNAEDYAHAIGTAVRGAVEKFSRADELIDEFDFDMTHGLMRDAVEAKNESGYRRKGESNDHHSFSIFGVPFRKARRMSSSRGPSSIR